VFSEIFSSNVIVLHKAAIQRSILLINWNVVTNYKDLKLLIHRGYKKALWQIFFLFVPFFASSGNTVYLPPMPCIALTYKIKQKYSGEQDIFLWCQLNCTLRKFSSELTRILLLKIHRVTWWYFMKSLVISHFAPNPPVDLCRCIWYRIFVFGYAKKTENQREQNELWYVSSWTEIFSFISRTPYSQEMQNTFR
jgi:hypothetical protein